MTFKVLKYLISISIFILLLGCGAYSFTGISLSSDTKTFQVNYFQNTAALIEPGIDRDFTITLQDLILNQPTWILLNLMETLFMKVKLLSTEFHQQQRLLVTQRLKID